METIRLRLRLYVGVYRRRDLVYFVNRRGFRLLRPFVFLMCGLQAGTIQRREYFVEFWLKPLIREDVFCVAE